MPPPSLIAPKAFASLILTAMKPLTPVGGLWCANLGYSNDVVKQAISDQLSKLPYYSAFAGTSNAPAIEAAETVVNFFKPDGMARAFFTSGGSDSVETALRLSRQYHRLTRPATADQISQPQERLSRHAFWRRLGQWKRAVPHGL
jgi:adenosylmethionine-8-amino-7-oxononanoate aminotransferase